MEGLKQPDGYRSDYAQGRNAHDERSQQRVPLRESGRCRFSGLRTPGHADLQRVDPNWVSDVLKLGRAEVADSEVQPAFDLAVGILGKTDRAGRRDALEPRSDVDAVAHQIAVGLLDDIAHVNADAKVDALLGRDASVALDHGGLDFDRAAHGVDRAAELDDRAVAGALDDAAMVHRDDRVNQVAAERPEPRQRAIFVRSCKPAIAGDVGDQNRRELPGLGHSSGSPALRRPSNIAGTPDECSNHHLIVSLGLILRASAKASFASSILPACA
jgi:hypothetical protein